MEKYIEDWLTIIEQMNNDNTYKLAFGRAILECIDNDRLTKDDKKVIVHFDDLSKCIIKYYWNQIFFFNLKQAPYREKEPVICKYVKELIGKYKLITNNIIPVWFNEGEKVLLKNEKTFFDKIVEKVSKTLHENVCWRFKNVSNNTLEIYEYNKSKGSILIFNYNDVDLIKEYNLILAKLLNYKWVQLLEGFNYAPKIANKIKGISNTKLKRNSLKKYKDALVKEFKNGVILDFYTDEPLSINEISIDHVIPWSFMYSDDIWNLVITSKSNNSRKSNSIPSKEIIKKLKERNDKLLNILNDSFLEDLRIAKKNEYIDKFYYECRL